MTTARSSGSKLSLNPMSWPQAQEYNEAIQNPNTAFLDADLRRGTVRQNKLGLPKAISGGFASVYEVTTPTGTVSVAPGTA